MLDIDPATMIVKKHIPDGSIKKHIEYNGLFIFQVFQDDPFEGEFDPFYSVNRTTGEFRDFSILTDGDFKVLSDLFRKAN